MDDAKGKLDYQVYLEERKFLNEAERDTAKQFDKAILTLAAGALGLSITFIYQIAPHPNPNSIFFLIIAWSLFSISILSTLISFLTSQEACRQTRDLLDQEQKEEKKDQKEFSARKWTNVLNYFSIGMFILGVIFLIVFSSINLFHFKEVKSMSDEKKIEEGYVPPEPPVKIPLMEPDKKGEKGYVPPTPPVRPPHDPKDKK